MQHKVFSVYDSKVEAYLPPVFNTSRGAMLRAVEEAVNNKDHQFSKYAADYTLFELGTFEDTTCTFQFHLSPLSLGNLVEFKQ